MDGMHPLIALLYGLVEGITEFLPISSTAHLMLLTEALRLPATEFLKTFEIVIQLGAILAVVVLYARTLLLSRAVIARVLVAFFPTGIIGFLLHNLVKNFFLESVNTVLWTLFAGGIVLILFERWHREKDDTTQNIAAISYKQALFIGVAQSIAIVPGVSRAAATIVGGLLLGLKRKTIVEFSFLLAIPTMAAASGYDLLKTGASFTSTEYLTLGIGFGASFVFALMAVQWLIGYIQNHTFTTFGVYRIVLACAGWLFL